MVYIVNIVVYAISIAVRNLYGKYNLKENNSQSIVAMKYIWLSPNRFLLSAQNNGVFVRLCS